MKPTLILSFVLLISCSAKKPRLNYETASAAEFLENLRTLSLPFSTETLERQAPFDPISRISLPKRVADSMNLKFENLNKKYDARYVLVGKLHETKEYITAIVACLQFLDTTISVPQYSIVSFNQEGKSIQTLGISYYRKENGRIEEADSFIDQKGNITIKTSKRLEGALGTLTEDKFQTDNQGKFTKSGTSEYPEETQIDWYYASDIGLISIEKARGNTIYFSLNRRSDQFCSPSVEGTATSDEIDSSYFFFPGNEKQLCGLFLKRSDNKLIITQQDKACSNPYNCAYEGTFEKVFSEKRSAALADIKTWIRKPIGEFSCLLKEKFEYVNEEFPCKYKNPDPKAKSGLEGPEFPKNLVKKVHPFIKDIQLKFEHGELRKITVVLENEMTLQSVQKIFDLPVQNKPARGIFNIYYGNTSVTDNAYLLSPVFIKELTLEDAGVR